MQSDIPEIQPGDYITADFLNSVRQAALRGDNQVFAGDRAGIKRSNYQIGVPAKADRSFMIKMLRDAVPDGWQNAASVNDPDYPNAQVLLWDETVNAWGPDGDKQVYVSASILPLKAGDQFPATYDRSSNRWFPANEKETERIRVTSSVAQAFTMSDNSVVNLYPGIIQTWQNDLLKWVDSATSQNCWVITPTGSAPGLTLDTASLVGHFRGLPVFQTKSAPGSFSAWRMAALIPSGSLFTLPLNQMNVLNDAGGFIAAGAAFNGSHFATIGGGAFLVNATIFWANQVAGNPTLYMSGVRQICLSNFSGVVAAPVTSIIGGGNVNITNWFLQSVSAVLYVTQTTSINVQLYQNSGQTLEADSYQQASGVAYMDISMTKITP